MLYFEKGCEYATYSERVRHHVANSWSFAAPMDSLQLQCLTRDTPLLGYWQEDDSWYRCTFIKCRTSSLVKLRWEDGTISLLSNDEVRLPKKRKAEREETEVALKRRKDSQAAVDVPASLSLKKRHQLPPHRYVLAPMVGGSELPFRMMTRRYGTQLCYTPMIYSGPFSKDQAGLLSENCSEIQKSQTISICFSMKSMCVKVTLMSGSVL